MRTGLGAESRAEWIRFRRLAVSDWERQRSTGDRKPVIILGSQVSAAGTGTGYQVRESGPGPGPEPEYPDQIPDGRDLRPENDLSTPANHPASGLPLSVVSQCYQPPTAYRYHPSWVGRPLPWPPFAKASATTGQNLRSYQSPSAHGRDSDHVPTSRQSLKGRPETGGLAGGISSGSRVSAVRCLVRVFRFGPRWRVAGIVHSVLYSVLNAALHSALRHRFSHLSSIQPSIQQHAMS